MVRSTDNAIFWIGPKRQLKSEALQNRHPEMVHHAFYNHTILFDDPA